jgi:hypothetical protein
VIFADMCINIQRWKKGHPILQKKSIVTCGIISRGQWKVWRAKGKG